MAIKMKLHGLTTVVSSDLIPDELNPIIREVIGTFRQIFGIRLQSVYLMGSACRGDYTPGLSDVDLTAIVKDSNPQDSDLVKQQQEALRKKFKLEKLDLDIYDLNVLNKNDYMQFFIIVDSLPVWGKKYKTTLTFPQSWEGLARMLALPILKKRQKANKILEEMKSGKNNIDIAYWGRYYAKKAIRLANCVVIKQTKQYNPNLKTMTSLINKNIPEISLPVKRLSQFRKTPPATVAGFSEILNLFDIILKVAKKYSVI